LSNADCPAVDEAWIVPISTQPNTNVVNPSNYTPPGDWVRNHARRFAHRAALVAGDNAASSYTWSQLDALMDRVAASLQRDGVGPGDAIALAGTTTPLQAALFLGALRAGAVVAPIAPSVTATNFASMLGDAQARHLFVDSTAAALVPQHTSTLCVALDTAAPGIGFDDWLMPEGFVPEAVAITPDMPFNIIYSSGTTGTPKGVVQPHGMRWSHVQRGARYAYSPEGTTLLATPLYSNTTLVVFFPTLYSGGTTVLMAKFDAGKYLELAERLQVTHTMLVPVQYQRIMGVPGFANHDLSRFRFKFCTSAPFRPVLKADVLARWPGGLVEFYGMTEGGGTCILNAHEHPDKLDTVGQPAEGHDIRIIDGDGRELPRTTPGEIVGSSPGMMTGYHRQPEKTREVEWFSPDGQRFIRTGDIGRFDDDGFLVLLDRKKDMVISGGFNIFPSDLEEQLRQHPGVADVAVVGVPSEQWGETPVAFVVPRDGHSSEPGELRDWLNARVGKTQRLSDLRLIAELPRSAIGKVLKRELRERYLAST
jgi:long-chain acyl-CoA synthetase